MRFLVHKVIKKKGGKTWFLKRGSRKKGFPGRFPKKMVGF